MIRPAASGIMRCSPSRDPAMRYVTLPLAALFAALLGTHAFAQGAKETLSSGVAIEHTRTGSGAAPKASDTVSVHYRGTLDNGTEFDSSYKRGQPATFPLKQVIPGWTEGVGMMNVGSKYEFWIPSDLAYGPQGSPPTIPPNATLHFEVELISFK